MLIWWRLRIFHTTPEKFEITALFLQKSIPSTLIRQEKGASQKRSSNGGNWNRRHGVLLSIEFILEIDLFENDDVILIMRVFLKHKSNMTGDCCVVKYHRRSVNRKHLMRFQSEKTVYKFLRRSVNRKHLMRFQSEKTVYKFLRRSVNRKHLMRFQSEKTVYKIPPA